MEPALCPVILGRDAELAALRTALADAGAGHGGLVVLTADAGIGKSRLLREVTDTALARGDLAVTGRAVGSGAATPFRPLTEAILQAVRASKQPHQQDHPWPAALRDVLPGAEPASTTDRTTDPPDIGPIMRGEAILRLLRTLTDRAASPHRALVLGLEDLQWADPDTLAIVEYLADNIRAEHILCVITVRPEPASPAADLVQALNARRTARILSLSRLSDEDTRRMVLACRPSASPDDLRDIVRAADGVPFLVEEMLATPGVPPTFAASVAARMAQLDPAERRVIQLAAVLGRQFDWRLLRTVSQTAGEQRPHVVGPALEGAVASLLLSFHGGAYQFRHALTREAIIDGVLPHIQAELARTALAALKQAGPAVLDSQLDLAADLAEQAGDAGEGARLLIESGRVSLRRGALATATATLRRAADLTDDDSMRRGANALLAEALALAGRLDECLTAGSAALRIPAPAARAAPAESAMIHLAIAHAAVEATRWPVAADHLASAEQLLATDPDPAATQRWRVLAAETALARRDLAAAQQLAELVIGSTEANTDVRCHALGLLGRSHRARDLDAARTAFEEALACADTANLPLWRLRSLHELGTIELFESAGVDRLKQARLAADELGALSTAAVLDIQLAAAYLFRFDPANGDPYAAAALAASEQLRLTQLVATALVFLAELRSLSRDTEAMERYNSLALAAAPGDPEIAGSVWGARAIAALLDGDDAGARRALERAVTYLQPLPNSGPGIYRGLWPVLLAVHADPAAAEAITAARQTGMTVNRANRGMLLYAEAVLAGRRASVRDGDGSGRHHADTDRQRADSGPDRAASGPGRAGELADQAAAELAHFPVWSDIARMLVAQAALADGWGDPRRWLASASKTFTAASLGPLAERCASLLARPARDRLAPLGVTPREREILDLVALGLSNRDIAAQLTVSHRTVEKHVESLLRKTGARSRTQLAAIRADALPGRS